jgi:hypothetical protein
MSASNEIADPKRSPVERKIPSDGSEGQSELETAQKFELVGLDSMGMPDRSRIDICHEDCTVS